MRRNIIATIAIIVGICMAGSASVVMSATFSGAKRLLKNENPEGTTYYCNCEYTGAKYIEREGCGYIPKRDNSRAKRLEWEHIVPASRLGKGIGCWNHPNRPNGVSNRKYCRRISPEFREAEADPVNLVPAIGEINGLRSDYPFGIIEGEPREFGSCDIEIQNGIAEPAEEDRRLIGVIYLYMFQKYGIEWQEEDNKEMYEAWARGNVKD